MSAAAPDARLSNFRLDRLLGSGGMGSVYLARDLTLNRDVAIKFISEDKTLEPIARARLVREAKAAAGLDHPNICSVYDVIDEPDGRAAIVMQYVKGASLADILRVGPLEPSAALSIAADVARALSAAHAQGIIHRDVKPANIMVTPDGRAKLLDFGVARYDDMSVAAREASTTTELTSVGLMIGTPPYMSPEQAQKRPLDGRSDLFSLGIVLFECLTGTRPFKGESPLEVLAAILHQQPPIPSSLRSGLNTLHDAVCLKLLAKDPADRFQSADELIAALNRLRNDPVPPPPSPIVRWLVLAAVCVALAGVAFWRWGLTPPAPNAAAAPWYHRGIESLRDGSYYGARLALEEATRADPSFVDGWIRLAEADNELDESDSAQRALLTVNKLVTSEWLMLREQRTRMNAVRAMILRDVDVGVQEYRALASAHPRDAGAWLDLGRAQEAAAFAADARKSYETAIGIDAQYAPAHLRRATILGLEGQSEKALEEFSEAERLYHAQGPNIEGEVETLIRRGTALQARGEAAAAREALTKASQLAATLQNRAQQIRAQLQLSGVTAWEGKWDDAEEMAAAAVEAATHEHFESVAADGLVDLSNVLILRGKNVEAGAQLERAIKLADDRSATRIAARARLQQASLELQQVQPARGITAAEALLPYFREKRYRRYELDALSIIGRCHERLGHYAEASRLGHEALGKAVEIKDRIQEGTALENLAGPANAVGSLPESLAYRVRETAIHRDLKDISSLPFDLVNQADVLIRLGRGTEGAQLLDEVDAAIARGIEAYLPRGRRVRALRALDAAIQGRPALVESFSQNFPPSRDGTADFNAQLAGLVLRYSERSRIPQPPNNSTSLVGSLGSTLDRELRYWDLAGRLARGDAAGALAGAEETLAGDGAGISYEFEWRAAAIGAAAAREAGDSARADRFSDRARRALDRLRREWKQDAVTYDARPDLQELRRRAGLSP